MVHRTRRSGASGRYRAAVDPQSARDVGVHQGNVLFWSLELMLPVESQHLHGKWAWDSAPVVENKGVVGADIVRGTRSAPHAGMIHEGRAVISPRSTMVTGHRKKSVGDNFCAKTS